MDTCDTKWKVFFVVVLMQNIAMAAKTVFVNVDALSFFSKPAHTQNLVLLNPLGNTYVASPQWHYDETLMLGIGLKTYQRNQIDIRTSLQFIPFAKTSSQGDVLQLNLPQFRNLAYVYDITSRFLLIDNVITWSTHIFQPGFLVGIGGASNTVSNYRETPLSSHAASSPENFAAYSQLQFAYEVGAVLDFVFKKISIRSAYRYLYAGNGRLGLSPLQNTSDYLSTGPLNYHVVSIGVRFEQTI